MLRGLRKYWHVIYVLLLVGFSIFVLLKTFVIPSVEKSDVESIGIYATEETETKTGNVITTENNYSDNNISIELSKERIYDTTVYIADIQLDDVKYLKTALAGNAFGRNINEKVSVMVAEKKLYWQSMEIFMDSAVKDMLLGMEIFIEIIMRFQMMRFFHFLKMEIVKLMNVAI